METIFYQGFCAYLDGKSIHENPYHPNTEFSRVQRERWRAGFLDAYRESKSS